MMSKKNEQAAAAEQKLRLLLDKLHGEDILTYDKLVEFLSDRCQVTVLKKKFLEKKKPLDSNLLIENDIFMLISPDKPWAESDIETVQRYVETHGGILVIMTSDGRKPEHLNKLLEPYMLSVTRDTISGEYFERDGLEGSQLIRGIGSLASGEVWGHKSAKISSSNKTDVVLRYGDAILGAKLSFGKGTVYLFSCLPVFGNKQLKRVDNGRFLDKVLVYELGWKPSNDIEKIHYLIAKEDWNQLVEIGKPSVGPLTPCLESCYTDTKINAVRTLGKIGDVKAIGLFWKCLIPFTVHTWSQEYWDHYNTLVPVVVEALTNMGKFDVEEIIKSLNEYSFSPLFGIPVIWALCKIGDRKATEAVVNWIFSEGPALLIESEVGDIGEPIIFYQKNQKGFFSLPDLIRIIAPPAILSKLLGDYTDPILDLFTWRLERVDSKERMQFDVSQCSKALEKLCEIKTPISSNILHKIAQIDKLVVAVEHTGVESTTHYIDYTKYQQMAREELKSRGNPPYDPSIYLNEGAWKL